MINILIAQPQESNQNKKKKKITIDPPTRIMSRNIKLRKENVWIYIYRKKYNKINKIVRSLIGDLKNPGTLFIVSNKKKINQYCQFKLN